MGEGNRETEELRKVFLETFKVLPRVGCSLRVFVSERVIHGQLFVVPHEYSISIATQCLASA